MNSRLQALLELRNLRAEPPIAPAGHYVFLTVDGSTVYLSGKVSAHDGEPGSVGRLETERDVQRGREAAETCALNMLVHMEHAIGLTSVDRLLKLTGFVASGPGFFQQPTVIDAASQIFTHVLGDAGKHARSAVGVAALPRNSAVEIELIARVQEGFDGRSV